MESNSLMPLSRRRLDFAFRFADESFLKSFLRNASDSEYDHGPPTADYLFYAAQRVDMPRTHHEVMDLILRDEVDCVRLLDGYIKLGFEPRFDVFPLESRDPYEGEQTGFVRFLERIFQNRSSICDRARLVGIFEWFIQVQDNVHSPSASDLDPRSPVYATSPGRLRPPIDHLTEMLKWQTSDLRICKHFINLICKMIEMLCAKGAVIDLYQDRFITDPRITRQTNAGGHKELGNAVEIAMMPYCPVSFLQTFLSNRTHEEQEFVAESVSWRPCGPDLPRGMHYAVTNMEWIVTRIHQDLFDENKHIGGRLGIGQEYQAKLSLLNRPDRTDSTELQALRNLVDVVANIIFRLETGLNDSHRKLFEDGSWFRLCRAVSGLADDSYRAQCDESSKYFGNRRHRFVVDVSWDPRMQRMEREFKKEFPDSDLCLSLAVRDEVLSIWRQMILERGDGRGWWAIEERDKWYVSAKEVEQRLRDEPLQITASMGS